MVAFDNLPRIIALGVMLVGTLRSAAAAAPNFHPPQPRAILVGLDAPNDLKRDILDNPLDSLEVTANTALGLHGDPHAFAGSGANALALSKGDAKLEGGVEVVPI